MIDFSLPDLPLRKYHRFIAIVGAIVAVLSLFVDTTFISNQTVFEMGAVAFIAGLIGWIVELFWSAYSRQKNVEWKHVIVQTRPGESPYDKMSGGRMLMVYLVALSRILIVVLFIFTEYHIYSQATF